MRKILLLLAGTAILGIIVLAVARTHPFLSAEASQKPILIKTFGHPSRIEKSPKGDFCTLYFSRPPGAGTQLWGVPKEGCQKLQELELGYFRIGKEFYYQAFLPKAETKKAETGGLK
jgi:hypothetical protein